MAAAKPEASAGVVEGTEKARNVLTDSMPQPPGVKERSRRRVPRKARKGPFAKYVGAASHRIIRASDWGQLAIDPKDAKTGHQTFIWNFKNDFMIETSQFTDEQLDYLFIDDMQASGGHSFLEVDYDDDKQLVQVVYDDDE